MNGKKLKMFWSYYFTVVIYFCLLSSGLTSHIHKKPNIILILADDMGWNDVSYHGSDQIPTPNIDALAYNGVILKNHYVQALCTPSRSALMTGKYPIHNGMQHFLLLFPEPRGSPLSDKFLPQYLGEAGYINHMIGKWHLGFYKKEYTPTYRGFDSHFGYWCGLQDYYNHEVESKVTFSPNEFRGFDMRRNMSVAFDTAGRYSTDLYTEEAVRLIEEHDTSNPMFLYLAHAAVHSGNSENLLQAPEDVIAKFSYISDPKRRTYAAMVSKLDESVGEVVAALRRRGMLENSILLFMSDNGAPTIGIYNNTGSNYPFRGIKNTLWEGGVHGAAAIWSPLIKKNRRVSNHLMHVTDWLPTLLSAAGIKRKIQDIDGIDMWPTISKNAPNPRDEVLINIDPLNGNSAIISGDYKYVVGTSGVGDAWYGDSGAINSSVNHYNPYNILTSKAGIALSEFTIEKKINKFRKYEVITPRDIRRFANYEYNHGELLTVGRINQLRSEAVIRCNVPAKSRIACNPVKSPCLFNIRRDPCEMVNLAQFEPDILQQLAEKLAEYNATSVPPNNLPDDPRSDPARWDGIWVDWEDSRPAIY